MTENLKELVQTVKTDLATVKDTRDQTDKLQAQDPAAALQELNVTYCDIIGNQTHNQHIPKLAAMGDKVVPVLDLYLQEYDQTVAVIQKMKPSMDGLRGLRKKLAEYQAKNVEFQKYGRV